MKKILLFILMTISVITWGQYKELEKNSPSINTEIVHQCSFMNIEGKHFDNVIVTLKAFYKGSEANSAIKGDPRVKVTVKDSKGKMVYKKTFRNTKLYIFSNGNVIVDEHCFHRITIHKLKHKRWYGKIIQSHETNKTGAFNNNL